MSDGAPNQLVEFCRTCGEKFVFEEEAEQEKAYTDHVTSEHLKPKKGSRNDQRKPVSEGEKLV